MSDEIPFENLPPILPPSGMKMLPSGLVVPTEAAMAREVWLHDEAKLFRRLLKFMGEKKIDILLKCKKCETILTITKQLDGTHTLDCDCTYREIRR